MKLVKAGYILRRGKGGVRIVQVYKKTKIVKGRKKMTRVARGKTGKMIALRKGMKVFKTKTLAKKAAKKKAKKRKTKKRKAKKRRSGFGLTQTRARNTKRGLSMGMRLAPINRVQFSQLMLPAMY